MAVSAGSQEKGAIGAMFEREMKQEKNLEVRLLPTTVTTVLPLWHGYWYVTTINTTVVA